MKEGDVVSLNFIVEKRVKEGCCTGCIFENSEMRCPNGIQINCDGKLVLKHYNDAHKKIPSFKPFDKVLYRDGRYDKWASSFISYIDEDGSYCIVDGTSPTYIVPYNDDTKYLWGNIIEAPKKYVWW